MLILLNSENRDKVETYLAFGATRFEACKPIATDALRLALTPNINQMRFVSCYTLHTLISDISLDVLDNGTRERVLNGELDAWALKKGPTGPSTVLEVFC